jgi:hypothetical protein
MNKTFTHQPMKLPIDSSELLRFAQEHSNEEPGNHIIDNLLRYSKSLEIKESKLIGLVETIGN